MVLERGGRAFKSRARFLSLNKEFNSSQRHHNARSRQKTVGKKDSRHHAVCKQAVKDKVKDKSQEEV
jgi:hypothetical protein